MRPAIALERAGEQPAAAARHSLHFPPTTQEGLASTPAHRRQSTIGLFALVSSHLISSHRGCHSIPHARTHCASLDPAAVELRLSAQTHFCYRQSSTSRQTPPQAPRASIPPCNPRQPQLQYTTHYAPAAVVLASLVPCRHQQLQQQRASEVAAAAYTRATYTSTSTTLQRALNLNMSKYLPLFSPIYPIPVPVSLPLPLPYLSLAAGRSQGLLTSIAFCAAVTEIVLAAVAS